MLDFSSDYLEGAHPSIIERLAATNLEKTAGYGLDEYSEDARAKIREACAAPNAEVQFLIGGTQTNATVIDTLLPSYQGVIAANNGHISVHEAGAIELGGHKVLQLPHHLGKIDPDELREYCENFFHDGNRNHMVMPGMVYLSQPTEYGTLYSLTELEQIKAVCQKYNLLLYADGARLAYALASNENDVTLPDLARLCDAFYIGGTKCGALFGEAVVIPDPTLIPHFFTIIKQHGALLAKGRLLGIQFDTLFTDGLYRHIGESAVAGADRMRAAFRASGYELAFDSPTNQVLVNLTNEEYDRLSEHVIASFWERPDAEHVIVRLACSWATTEADITALEELLASMPASEKR